jgi:tripartite-type tricarboxylate transporter receptor subunit TctC
VKTPFRVAVCCCAALSAAAVAQEYPSKTIRLVVPLAPGGSADVLARFLAPGLTESLGRSVVVDNRSGGGGHIGSELVAKAPPDGYTLLIAGSPQAIGMSLYQKLPYDMARDLAAVTQGAIFPSILAVHPSLPVKSMKELLALGKARPGQLNYGANTGSPNHLGMELLGIRMNFIPYKGAGAVVTDLIAGQIQLASLGFPGALPHVQSGRLRAIAVTGQKRSPQLPDVPTVNESGVPGYVVTLWFGLFAPAGTPRDIVVRLNTETAKVLRSPDIGAKLTALGAEVSPSSPEDFARFVREEIVRWEKVVKALNIKPD